MVHFIRRWIHHALRPKITTVHVHIFENSVERPVERYTEHRQLALLKSIEALFESREASHYWFEANIYEYRSCTQKKPATVCLTCYKENQNATSFKQEVDIPHKYRRKLFDTIHTIHPEQVGQVAWPSNMSVKFVLPK
jgi:hypothetical protein